MPDDRPTSAAPELRPAARRRPAAVEEAPEALEPTGALEPTEPVEPASGEEAALAAAAAPEAQAVTAEVTAQEADAATSAFDVGAAAAEVAAPAPPQDLEASWSDRAAQPPSDEPAADAAAAPEALAPAAAATKKAAKKAPATKAPAAAPAKKAAAKKAPAKAPAKKAAAAKAPAKKAVAGKAADAAVLAVAASAVAGAELSAAALPPLAPVAAPEPPAAPAAPVVPASRTATREPDFRGGTVLPEPRGLPAGARLLVALTVLLLAAAVGMGAAALVENGQETWRSTLTVRFVPGLDATGDLTTQIATAQQTYAARVPNLTGDVLRSTGVPEGDVRHALKATLLGKDQLLVQAEAARGPQAEALVIRAAYTVVAEVPRDQARDVANPAERLSALVSGYATQPERTRPSDQLALVVGLAAGLAVLMLAGTLTLIARGRD